MRICCIDSNHGKIQGNRHAEQQKTSVLGGHLSIIEVSFLKYERTLLEEFSHIFDLPVKVGVD